jgi:hypothetical protein
VSSVGNIGGGIGDSLSVPNTPAFQRLLGFLKGISRQRSFGLIRTPDGDDFVVVRPEQIAHLDAVLSDPAFIAAIEHGVRDVAKGRVKRVPRGLPLHAAASDAADSAVPCDPAMAKGVESGVKDVLAGKVIKAKRGRSLKDLC